MGKDLSETVVLNLQGVINANSRFTFKSWKSTLSNAQNWGTSKNSAEPKKPKQTQLWKTRYSAEETGSKLGL